MWFRFAARRWPVAYVVLGCTLLAPARGRAHGCRARDTSPADGRHADTRPTATRGCRRDAAPPVPCRGA